MGPRIELRHVTSFLAIAEELHFGRAAARLHLAQPSLSQQLQRLERQVGVELVARNPHEVRLTPAGQAFEVAARQLLDQADHAVRAARDAAAGRTGSITVGFNFDAGQRVLTPTLRRLNADHPKVTTTLVEARSGTLLDALDRATVDVALGWVGSVPAGLRARRLLTVPLVLLLSRRHTWAGRTRVPFRELAHQPIVLSSRETSPAMHDAVLAAARRCGITLTVGERVDDVRATAIVVATRPVVAFASAAHLREPAEGLVTVGLTDPEPTVDIHAVWRPDAGPAVGLFLDSLVTDDRDARSHASK